MTDEFDPVRRNAIRWLDEADAAYGCGRYPTAVMASCYAIEETIKFAHLTWGIGESAVLGGGSAHKARATVAKQTLNASEASAAASHALGNAYPHNHVVSENPLEAKAARVELARREIALEGLKDDLRRANERMKHGQAPARMKNLAEFRERATYASEEKGKWVSPEEQIGKNSAKALIDDARRAMRIYEVI